MAALTSPGKVVGTPPRRTSWVPSSPSPLRNSFTTDSYPQSNEDTEDDDEEILKLKLQHIQAQLALKRAQKKKIPSSTSNVQVPKSPSPVPVPVSPMRVVLGIDRGKKASEVSLKNPWKPPTESPTKPKASFADRLASVVRENKRKSAQNEERERKKAKTFSAIALASAITNHETEEWCKYTGFNLRTRVVSQATLKEEFKGKTTYSISDLYRLVVPPSYDPPEYDTPDFLVTGIVASKSPVRQIKNRDEGGNYLVVKITDLKMDIDLFLFGSAFTETWKLQRGMVIVLLNPGIFKKKDGKGFNLRMNENRTSISRQPQSSDVVGGESVLEVGFSRDWAGCEALRADGTLCGDWVDTRHTKICEYHVDQGMKRARKGRMEYAVGMRPFSPKKEKEARNPFAPRKVNEKNSKPKKVKTSEPDRWDGGGGSIYHSKGTSNTNNELDTTLTTKKRVEAIKRDLKGSEREREIRRIFKPFAPSKSTIPPDPTTSLREPTPNPYMCGASGKLEPSMSGADDGGGAFDAKRVRQIGFDPRRKVNEEVTLADRKIVPIVGGQRISLDGVLGGDNKSTGGKEDVDSDSDSDLDIIMEVF